MIGKKVLFIRTKWKDGDRGVDKHIEYPGTILDKISSVHRFEGRIMKVDKYLVELKDGVIADFFCDEATKVIKEEHPENSCQWCGGNNPCWYAPNELWNKITEHQVGLIICPSCFQKKADEIGINLLFKAHLVSEE